MLIILYIVLLILVVTFLYFLNRKIAWFSSKKFFIVLVIILLITGFLFFKLIYKINKQPTNPNYIHSSSISKNNKPVSDYENYINKKIITIGTVASVVPWSYTVNSKVVGYNISVLQKAVKLMGKNIQIKVFAHDTELYDALENKEIDIIGDLRPIDLDSIKYSYSCKVVDPPFVFIIKEKNLGKFLKSNTNLNYLINFINNKRISTLDVIFLKQYLTDLLPHNSNLKVYNSSYEIIKSIENETADVAFVEYFSFLSYNKLNPRCKIVMLHPILSDVAKNGFAFVVNKSDMELKKQLDIALSLLKRRGELASISIDYFKEDVTL